MAPYFDPSAGMFGTPPGGGVMASPVQNPLAANPLDAQTAQSLEGANAQERLKRAKTQLAQMRAAVLREQLNPGIKGGGTLGIRTGEGPGGWATSLGDLAAMYVRAKALGRSAEEVGGAASEIAPAENTTYGALNARRRFEGPNPSYVPQGSPLSLSNY